MRQRNTLSLLSSPSPTVAATEKTTASNDFSVAVKYENRKYFFLLSQYLLCLLFVSHHLFQQSLIFISFMKLLSCRSTRHNFSHGKLNFLQFEFSWPFKRENDLRAVNILITFTGQTVASGTSLL